MSSILERLLISSSILSPAANSWVGGFGAALLTNKAFWAVEF